MESDRSGQILQECYCSHPQPEQTRDAWHTVTAPLRVGSTLLSSPEDSVMTGIHPSPANTRSTVGPSQDLHRSG